MIVDPNTQRPPEQHSCVERKLLDGAKLPLRKMKSASRQVGAAPAKPLAAAAQQLFGGRATGKGAASSPGPSLPPDRVSVACAISNSKSPAKPCWVASLARDAARPRGSRYPKGLKARPREAGRWGGGDRLSASLLPQPDSRPAPAGPLSSARNPLHPGNACLPCYLVTTPPVA